MLSITSVERCAYKGVYPRGRYSTWEYDLVYSFEHASDYNPAYFHKNKYGIRYSQLYIQSLMEHVFKRNDGNFYSKRNDTVDWKRYHAQMKAAFTRLAMGNMHVVGWDPELEEKIRDLKPSDVAEITGFLLDVKSNAGGKWIAKSSVALGLPDDYTKVRDHRDFFGCEIIWITDLEIYRQKEGVRTKYFGGTPVQTKGLMEPLEVYWKEHRSRKKAKAELAAQKAAEQEAEDGAENPTSVAEAETDEAGSDAEKATGDEIAEENAATTEVPASKPEPYARPWLIPGRS